MQVSIALRLPRDAASVPMIRQMLDAELCVLGVEDQIRDDIRLMLSEACANVIRHAHDSLEYTVSAEVFPDVCVIKVQDTGTGFGSRVPDPVPAPLAEHGRGLQIMRALADDVRFDSDPGDGSIVRMEKLLRYRRRGLGCLLVSD